MSPTREECLDEAAGVLAAGAARANELIAAGKLVEWARSTGARTEAEVAAKIASLGDRHVQVGAA